MALELDPRQRAMLQAMGVAVWLPETASRLAQAEAAADIATAALEAVQRQARPPVPVRVALPAPPSLPAPVLPATDPSSVPSHGLAWPALVARAAACQECGLHAGRKHSTLGGDAPTQADWLLLGDAPDADEDRAGAPFMGEPGLLLDAMLRAVGAQRGGSGRAGAYVSNALKCRPPPGQVPQAADIAQCSAYVQQEIALVQPKIIVALGRWAAQSLLGAAAAALPLDKQRGTVYRYQGVPVLVSYAPAQLLRNQAAKAKAWADWCLALELLSVQSPP